MKGLKAKKGVTDMTDAEIIKLYFDRSERAIEETDRAYGKYCRYISFEFLHNREDSEEIVNDAYLKTWESIPPEKSSFLERLLGQDRAKTVYQSPGIQQCAKAGRRTVGCHSLRA